MKRILRVVSWISQEVPAVAARHKVWAGIVIVLAFLAVVIYLPRLPLVGPRSGRAAESDFRGHLLQALGGLVIAVGAYFTGRTFALNREGQITERFTRAVEQPANKELDIRLGGIYALERIARDSETHYEPVIEVLTAFLREHAHWRPENRAAADSARAAADSAPLATEDIQELEYPPKGPEPPVDIQAVATALGRRDRRHERPDYRLDLRRVDLRGVSLPGADLRMAMFNWAHLEEADLEGAHLEGARINRAHLEEAGLDSAHLEGAHLEHGTHLEEASMWHAHLERAWLRGAHLEGAFLEFAFLEGAHLEGADLQGAHFEGAHLEGANLSNAIGLTQDQLAKAITDEKTRLPDDLSREPGG
jgi:Pentapeptide repeats (8 copies)